MSKFRKNNTKKALLFTLAFAVIIAGALAVTLLTDWNPLGNLVGPTQEDPGKTEPENPQPDNMVDVEPNDPEPELPVTFNIPDRMRAVTILPGEDYLTENGGIIFPNPNAPTGLMENLDTIEEIVAKNPDSVVIVDEAYVDFGGVSALPLVDKYENLLVVQTFSKSRALAGMRIGFAIGQKKLISYLNDVKFSFNSYTMNRLTIACGKACVEDRAYFQEITGKIVATREWTKQKLTELGFTFPDSKANFIFATHKTVPAQELFENLKTAGIYVRYFKKPRIDNYLRITVGTQAEMERLVEVLVELVK